MRRFASLTVLALALAGFLVRGASAAPATLKEAVEQFNERYRTHSVGKDQPPLTEAEVIAALRWEMLDRQKLSVSDETFQALRRLTETGELPAGFELEVLTGYEPNDRMTFDVWSVRLRVPRAPFGTHAIEIRETRIRSRLIGPEERKVIHEWQEKERARGGIGSMERADWLRRYYEARRRAAELDRGRKSVPEK